jgi:signal transduction histidine kinase
VEDLRKINQAGKHLLNLINEILDLSKVEAGKMALARRELLGGAAHGRRQSHDAADCCRRIATPCTSMPAPILAKCRRIS